MSLIIRKSDKPDWRSRHGAAVRLAKDVSRQAGILGHDLVRLAGCESDHETLHQAIVALRAELLRVERLASEFECLDQYKRAHG